MIVSIPTAAVEKLAIIGVDGRPSVCPEWIRQPEFRVPVSVVPQSPAVIQGAVGGKLHLIEKRRRERVVPSGYGRIDARGLAPRAGTVCTAPRRISIVPAELGVIGFRLGVAHG